MPTCALCESEATWNLPEKDGTSGMYLCDAHYQEHQAKEAALAAAQ